MDFEFVESEARSDGAREWFGMRIDCSEQDGDAVDVRAPRAAQSARDFFSESGGGGSSRRVGIWGHAPYVERSSCSTLRRAADDVCCGPMCTEEKT